jgi:hypothetical protein
MKNTTCSNFLMPFMCFMVKLFLGRLAVTYFQHAVA